MGKREAVVANVRVLSRYLQRGPEVNHRISRSGYMLHRLSSKWRLLALVLENVNGSGNFYLQTLSDLRNSYVPERPAQVEFSVSRN
jgi:hypothetical protein